MSNSQKPHEILSYFALALDPIHVGTGGYRLGRVDMSIVREPGTNLPKIPGTSIAGACRTYAAMQENGKFPNCAGQGQPSENGKNRGHCGNPNCPICVTFGFSKGERGSFQGLAQFSDARLVLFPVHSLAGPVWVTCPDVMKDLNVWQNNGNMPKDSEVFVANGELVNGRLNLGWLMLNVKSNNFSLDNLGNVPEEIRSRLVLVSNKMYGHIVNDNLEVRTSVSINPETGAAADRALFTYEALPRGSVLAFDVVVSNPKFYKINRYHPLNDDINKVIDTVDKGLNLFSSLGVGGMNTRGMGRTKIERQKEGGTP